MKEVKSYCLKLIDELGNCYFSFTCNYSIMRKAVSLWRKARKNIFVSGDVTVYKAPTGEELWVFENEKNHP